MAHAGSISVGFRNISTFNKLKNPHAAPTRSYIFEIWRAQGCVYSILDHWMSVDVWFQLLKNNMKIHLPSNSFFYEKVLQEAVIKDPIINFFVGLNINYVRIY